MLLNNADARRCSYFELGLPVVILVNRQLVASCESGCLILLWFITMFILFCYKAAKPAKRTCTKNKAVSFFTGTVVNERWYDDNYTKTSRLLPMGHRKRR